MRNSGPFPFPFVAPMGIITIIKRLVFELQTGNERPIFFFLLQTPFRKLFQKLVFLLEKGEK
jgi:hypothetical protein